MDRDVGVVELEAVVVYEAVVSYEAGEPLRLQLPLVGPEGMAAKLLDE